MSIPARPLEVYLRIPGPNGRLTSDDALLAEPEAARGLSFDGYLTGGFVIDDGINGVVFSDDLQAIYHEIVVEGRAALQAGSPVRYQLRGDPYQFVLEPDGEETRVLYNEEEELCVPTALLIEKLAQTAERFEKITALAAGG